MRMMFCVLLAFIRAGIARVGASSAKSARSGTASGHHSNGGSAHVSAITIQPNTR
jgi:hypothetical protein